MDGFVDSSVDSLIETDALQLTIRVEWQDWERLVVRVKLEHFR